MKYIDNQTPELCLIALKHDILAIQYIRYLNNDIRKYLASYNKSSIDLFATIQGICMDEVMRDGMRLQHIEPENQTEEMCKIAVSKNGDALQYVANQTEELCKIAVLKDVKNLIYVKKQTVELCKLALDIDCWAYGYIRYPTDELCIYAMRKNEDLCIEFPELWSYLHRSRAK